MKLKTAWLSFPGTALFGWSFQRLYFIDHQKALWKLWPGWSFAIWIGFMSLTLETSGKKPLVEAT
jgi:hypothetical protein